MGGAAPAAARQGERSVARRFGLPRTLLVASLVASLGCAAELSGGADDDAPATPPPGTSETTIEDGLVDTLADAGEAADLAADAATDPAPAAPPACSNATVPCQPGECCAGLRCGATTLGQVCCGDDGASCSTWNGEDCCDDLLCVDGRCQKGPAMFKAPFPCGQRWTYSHHSAEVRQALDFIRDDGGSTAGAQALASAGGTAHRKYEAGGAGNYIVIDHSGGWTTYYFHLQSFIVGDGATVSQGDPIGVVGSTGASSGAHLHYEQLQGGAGQTIRVNGQSLAPYPSYYGTKSLTSDTGCP